MAKILNDEDRVEALKAYDPTSHLIEIKGKDGKPHKYLPASWRIYELNLRYPGSCIRMEPLLADIERNMCVIRCTLTIGERTIEDMKSGSLSTMDKVATAALARCCRNAGISTEYALEWADEDIEVEEEELADTEMLNGFVRLAWQKGSELKTRQQSAALLSKLTGKRFEADKLHPTVADINKALSALAKLPDVAKADGQQT